MEILANLNRTLFITKSGKKIHLRRNCLTIKDSYVIELKYEDIDKEKYCTICQKCVAKEKIFKSQVPYINKNMQNRVLSISSIHANSNFNSTRELEPIPDDFTLSLNNINLINNNYLNKKNNNNIIINNNNYNNKIKNNNNSNNSNNNSNNNSDNNNNSNNNSNNNNNSDNNSNNINIIQNLSNSSDDNIITIDKSNLNNFNIIEKSYQNDNFIDSISKKEPSFINKPKSQNNDCLNIDEIDKIYIDDEESTDINTNKQNNLKNDLKEIKLNFKNDKKFNRNNSQYNFSENYIFSFNIEVILKKNLCKMATGFSIKYIDNNDEDDSFDTIKLVHDFTIKNNSKINYWINLKEGYFNLNIQKNKKISKKKKYFEKINLFNIIQIKPYLKIDKENECEYYINDEKINIKQN